MMAELLDTEVTEGDIVEIAKKYLRVWEELSPYLKLESGTDEIIRRTRGGYAEEKKALLSEWRRLHGRSGATFRVLIGAAEQAGNMLLADDIRSMMLRAKRAASGQETDGGAYQGAGPGETTQASGNQEDFGSIQDDSGNRGGEVRRRRRRETSQQHLVPEPPKPPPNTFVTSGWTLLLFRNKILVIVVVILLILCSFGLLYYNRVTEAVLIWVIILFLVRMMFYKKEIPKRDFHLDTKNGVLILVTSTYNGTLPLTVKDRNEMITTFTQLDYYIAELRDSDANRSNVLMLLQQLSDYLSGYSGPLSGQALVFGFSGHGGRKDTLITNNGHKLSLRNDILPHFVGNPQLYDVKKLFFIDACRGHSLLKKNFEDIPRSNEKTTKSLHYEEGNYLIAYATISDHVSYDGYWMHKLARRIRDNFQKPLTSILNDLAGELPKHQQPEITGRLRGDFAFK